jgi:DNA/RNA endonuclease YhcR with UshA esterase domain
MGEDRTKFGEPERFEGKRVCVGGMIRLYRGAAEIILHDPKQFQP